MKRKYYEKPTMTVVELQHRSAVLLQTSGEPPKYNGFGDEEEM